MRRTFAAIIAALAVPTTAHANCNTRACTARVADRQCSQRRVAPCIRLAAVRHRQSFAAMRAVAICESQLNPYAHNPSGASGLFQFMPGTFASTPYGWRWIYSARWNAMAAGWMFRHGRRGEWVC